MTVPGDGAAGNPGRAPQLLTGWGNRPRSRALVVSTREWDTPDAQNAPDGRDVPDAGRREPPGEGEPGPDRQGRGAPGRGVLGRGLGRSYGDAALNAGGTVVDMTGASRLLSLDAERGVVRAEAGMSFADLLRTSLPHGWFPPVTPGTRHVTLGGALASDVHGKNHHVDGSFAQHLERLTLQGPDGRCHELVPGDDAFAATAGGMGLTGLVREVTLRLVPVRSSWMRVRTERTPDLDETMARMAVLDRDARYAVAWVDLLAAGGALGRGVLTTGDHADPQELPAAARRDPLAAVHDARLALPSLPAMPAGGPPAPAVRAFNELYWRRAPRQPRTRPEPMGSFFYPLDVVDRWNRVYGSAGFVQYQFVVPFEGEETLRRIVALLADHRCPSFLAVLKRFGAGTGMLSFPIEGWTLAIDIPAGVEGLPRLLDRFDEDVAAAGGRVYLAKDGRMRPGLLATMYPELERWRAVQRRLDPDQRMNSDLARRLRLLGG